MGSIGSFFLNARPNGAPATEVAARPRHAAETTAADATFRDISGHFPGSFRAIQLPKSHSFISVGARARLTHACARDFPKSREFQ